ncbi:hypothetical protein D3C87_219370 [compost metagenome]
MAQIIWSDLYLLISKVLTKFYLRHGEEAGRELYLNCNKSKPFRDINSWFSDPVGKSRERKSLDPLVIFASFNDINSRQENRSEKIKVFVTILNEFGNIPVYDSVNFDGCPTPLSLHLISDRSSEEQREIWELFARIVESGRRAFTEHDFKYAKKWYGVNIPSFTMFLFWISPREFLPMDTNTVSYLISRKHITRQVRDYKDYIELLYKLNDRDFVELSKTAYTQKESTNLQSRDDGLLNRQIPYVRHDIESASKKSENPQKVIPEAEKTDPENEMAQESSGTPDPEEDLLDIPKSVPVIGEYRLVALKVYENTPKKIRKTVPPETYHLFSKAFGLLDGKPDNVISYDPTRDIKLYNSGGRSIHVSAIVGKNGSGKSAISELIFMAINNLSEKHKDINVLLEFMPQLHLDLYFSAEYLYKIAFRGHLIQINRYEPGAPGFINPQPIGLDEFKFDEFFYSISINYAHFALNEVHIGSWINEMFHKNDSYQAPLVINPHRIRGNINVNTEESFGTSRLLANILVDVDPLAEKQKAETLRKLTDTLTAETLHLSYNKQKVQIFYSYEEPRLKSEDKKKVVGFDKAKDWVDFVKMVCNVFDITFVGIPSHPLTVAAPIHVAFKYIMRKAAGIAVNYSRYHRYLNPRSGRFKMIENYLKELKADQSHVTYKLKQAVNFIKYDHIRKYFSGRSLLKDVSVDLDVLAKEIQGVIDLVQSPDTQVIHLIPPSFLKTEIQMAEGIKLSDLSSGEKQRIYATSAIAYHLINVNSKISESGLIPYRFALVLFDEVELYFHPEMQRGFIDHLLKYLSYLPLDQLTGIQLTFITHSPFILSDILTDNILFMGGEGSHWKTFGANIHDLLADSFFLDKGFMGEFVKHTIQSLAAYLNDEEPIDKRIWDIATAWQVIRLIGEPVIKERLDILFNKKFGDAIDRDNRIAELESELIRLKHEKDLQQP